MINKNRKMKKIEKIFYNNLNVYKNFKKLNYFNFLRLMINLN